MTDLINFFDDVMNRIYDVITFSSHFCWNPQHCVHIYQNNVKVCLTWLIKFLDLLCVKFHYCQICVTDFRKEGFFAAHYPWAALKRPILNRVKDAFPWSFHLTGVEIGILHFSNSFYISVFSLRILSKISLDILSRASFVLTYKMM